MKDSKDSFKKNYGTHENFKRLNSHLYRQFDDDTGVALQVMFNRQRQIQDAVKARFGKDTLTPEMIKDHSLSLVIEIAEILDRLPFTFKHWKKVTDDEKLDMIKDLDVAEEVIDALHFLMNIWLCLGYDAADMYAMYIAKSTVNLDRQAKGY